MEYVLTFVNGNKNAAMDEKTLRPALTQIESHRGSPINSIDLNWVKDEHAAEVTVAEKPSRQIIASIRGVLFENKVDVFVNPTQNRVKKLLLADMDSTIVEGETLDDLAAHAGIKDQIAGITARAMNGELDFHAAIRERVGLLKGLNISALNETVEALVINPGAREFIKTMKHHGTHCVLVSGGFTIFTAPVAEQIGFDNNHGNTLNIDGNVLGGTVADPILDKDSKVEFLNHYMEKVGATAADCLTIGDGANDIPMLKTAQDAGGLGIGYRAKDAVAKEIDNLLLHGDLTAALYAQGLTPLE